MIPTVKSEAPPVQRVWLGVRGVMARTGRGRIRVLDALAEGREHYTNSGEYLPGDLRGYQTPPGPGGQWSIHVDDVDAWVRGEAPRPLTSGESR